MVNIKIIFQNVNSIVALHKRHELNTFLNRHRPDIMLIAEHRLSKKHYVNLNNYQFVRQTERATHTDQAQRPNSESCSLSVAICIKNGMRFETIPFPQLKYIEAVAIKIPYRSSNRSIQHLIAVSLYKRPRDPLLITDLNKIKETVNLASGKTIIGCDLNAKHPSWNEPYFSPTHLNAQGRQLHNWLDRQLDLILHPSNKPSRVSNNSKSSIDYFIGSVDLPIDSHNICHIIDDFPSDHYGVKLNIQLGRHCLINDDPRIVQNFNKINTLIWNRTILQNLSPIPAQTNISHSEIDNSINNLNAALGAALDSPNAIPKITISPTKPNNRIELNAECLRLIKSKKIIRRYLFRRQLTLSANEKSQLRTAIKRLSVQINTQIHDSNLRHIECKLRLINPDNISLKTLKGIGPQKEARQSLNADIHLTTDEQSRIDIRVPPILKTNFNKLNALAWSFEQIHKQNDTMSSNSPLLRQQSEYVNRRTTNLIESPLSANPIVTFDHAHSAEGSWDGSEELGFTNAKQLLEWIKQKNSKKTVGPDGSSNFLLKHCNMFVIKHIAILFNHCYNIGYFPTAWKRS